MKTKNRRIPLLLLALIVVCCAALPSCTGPDPVRLRAERANWALAKHCAEGWFGGLPFTEHDQKLVGDAFADWDSSLKAEERLAGWPGGGASSDAGGGK